MQSMSAEQMKPILCPKCKHYSLNPSTCQSDQHCLLPVKCPKCKHYSVDRLKCEKCQKLLNPFAGVHEIVKPNKFQSESSKNEKIQNSIKTQALSSEAKNPNTVPKAHVLKHNLKHYNYLHCASSNKFKSGHFTKAIKANRASQGPVSCDFYKLKWRCFDPEDQSSKQLINQPFKVSEKLLKKWRQEVLDETRPIRNILYEKKNNEKVITEDEYCSEDDDEVVITKHKDTFVSCDRSDNFTDISKEDNAVLKKNEELTALRTNSQILPKSELRNHFLHDHDKLKKKFLSKEGHANIFFHSRYKMTKEHTKSCTVKLNDNITVTKSDILGNLKKNNEMHLKPNSSAVDSLDKCEEAEFSKDKFFYPSLCETYQCKSTGKEVHSAHLKQKRIFKCHSMSIGSYTAFPTLNSSHIKVILSEVSLSFNVSACANSTYTLAVTLKSCDIAFAHSHVGNYPVLILEMTSNFMANLRKLLDLLHWTTKYADLTLKGGEQNKIVFWFNSMTDDLHKLLYHEFLGITKIRDQRTADEMCPKSPLKQQVSAEKETEPEITVLFCAHDPNGYTRITSNDIACLEKGKLLNDVIMDLYAKYIYWEKISDEKRTKIHIFNSYFLPELDEKGLRLQEVQKRRIARWTKDVDIFSKDYIIIPLNRKSHWFLAIICFPGHVPSLSRKLKSRHFNDFEHVNKAITRNLAGKAHANSKLNSDKRKKVQQSQMKEKSLPCIYFFNSLKEYDVSVEQVASTLRGYLEVEWEVKKGNKVIFDSESMPSINVACPQQENVFDCGLYVLQYMLMFLEKPVLYIGDAELSLSKWFTSNEVSEMRNQIKELIIKKSSHC